jgi:hypothetical protein
MEVDDMKPIQWIFSAISLRQVPLHRLLLYVLFLSYLFCFALLSTVGYALLTGFGKTPAMVVWDLLPGLLLFAGAFIKDNMLSRGVGSSIIHGLLSIMAASLCMILWNGVDSIFMVATLFGGFGFAAVTRGVTKETAAIPPAELPPEYRLKAPQAKLLGAVLGAVYAMCLILPPWGGVIYNVSLRAGFTFLLVLLCAASVYLYLETRKSTS